MKSEDLQINILFVRHGEYDPEDKQGVHGSGLTELGVAESRTYSNLLQFNPDLAVGYSMDNLRSLGTLTLALYPELEIERISEHTKLLRASRRLSLLASLDYIPVEDEKFEEELTKAYNEGRNLDFLVKSSDPYREVRKLNVSTYSYMARDMADLILQKATFAPAKNGDLVIPSRDELYCAREFVFGSFRAKLTEALYDTETRDKYVSWYGEEVELIDEARTSVIRIAIESEDGRTISIKLEDAFGKLSLDKSELAEICEVLNRQVKPLPTNA